MKKNSCGFVLIETLIISTVVAGILIYIFVQFNSLETKYNDSFAFNDVDDLYRLDNIKKYINSLPLDNKNNIITKINNESKVLISLVDGTYQNIDYIDNQDIMLEDLNIKNLIITTSDIDKINKDDLNGNLLKNIKKIDSNGSNYRLIAEFNNGNVATISFNMEGL